MSRTYDALRRVEKESSQYEVIDIGDIESSVAIPVPGEDLEPPVAESTASDETSQTATTLNCTRETLLARCPPTLWTPDAKTMLFFSSEEGVSGTEEFRTLRTQLRHLRDKQPLRRILVTSSVPKEGRSFVAANLAQALARQAGCQSLLVDADLRNPSLHSSLGAKAGPGLSDYLLGEAEEFDIIQRGQMENLFFIASGKPISGQAEVVSNGRLKTLLDRLDSLFDWIVIDSPPALPVSDSGLIANLCEGVLIVVRSNSTPFDVVRKARQKFSYERILGVVLNGNSADL